MKKFVYSWCICIVAGMGIFLANIGGGYAQSVDSLVVDDVSVYNVSAPKDSVRMNTIQPVPLAAGNMNFEYRFNFYVKPPINMSYDKANKFTLSVQFEGEAMQVLANNVDLNGISPLFGELFSYRIRANGKRLVKFQTVSRNKSGYETNEKKMIFNLNDGFWEEFFWDTPCPQTNCPSDFTDTGTGETPKTALHGYIASLTIIKVPRDPVLTTYPDHILSSEGNVLVVTNFSNSYGPVYRFDWAYNYHSSGGSWHNLGRSGDMNIYAYRLEKEEDGTDFLTNIKNKKPLYVRAANACISEPDNVQTPDYASVVALQLKLDAPQILGYSAEVTPPGCAGGRDGQVKIPFDRKLHSGEVVQLTLTNLDDPLGYKPSITLRNEENFVIFTGLSAGRYEVKYTNGYILNSTIPSYIGDEYRHKAQFTVSDPPKLSLSGLNKTDVHCKGGSDGTITFTPTGGTGDIRAWYTTAASYPVTRDAVSVVPGLAAANYTIELRDANDCRMTDAAWKVNIAQPATGVSLQELSKTDPRGYGLTDGAIEVIARGGTGGFTYSWQKNGQPVSGSGSKQTGLGDGRYKITVKDANYNKVSPVTAVNLAGCQSTVDIELRQPDLLSVSIGKTGDISCYGLLDGVLRATATGGVGGYRYEWYKSVGGSWAKLRYTTAEVSGLDAGVYRAFVFDRNDIKAVSANYTLTQPDPVRIAFKTAEPACYGGSDGRIEAVVTGGNGGYTYTWPGNPGTSSVIYGEAQNYVVKVKDRKDCRAENNVTIGQPARLTATAQVVLPASANASDGKITVSPSGGTPGYHYRWDYRNSVSNPLTGIPADSVPYRVVVKDAHQCEIELNPRILYPLMVGIREKQPVSCYGRTDGRLEALAEGGVSSIYFYKWYKRENDGFREIAGEESVSEPLGDGIYRVEVRDSEHNQAVSQEFIFRQPDSLRLKFGHLDPLCKDDRNGWINALVEGGTEPYHYLWEDKTDFDAFNRSNLACGFYKVTVTDSHGCQLTGRDTLTEPDSLLVTHEVRFPSVFNGTDGTIRLFPKGGTEPYRYEWTYNHSTDNPLAGLAASDTPYEVTVTDAHGCTVSDTPRMYNPLIVEIQVRDSISCYGRLDGRLAAVFAGGVGAPHDFEWFKKDREGHFRKTGANDSILYGVPDGEYRVSVRDRSDSLAVSDVFVFRHPDSLQLQFRHHFPLCKHDANGWTEALADGGTTPYRYYWEDIDREDAALRAGLEDGVYKAVVTDRRGCVVSATDTLTEPDSLIVRHKVDFPSVYGGDDGMVAVSPEGGTKPYRYAWDYNHSVANPLTGLSAMADPLHVVVTDAHGCQVVDSVRMYNPITIELEESGVIICSGQTNAELTAHVKGGAGRPYRFEWYFVEEDLLTGFTETDSLLKSVGVGTYRVAAFDSVGNLGWSADYTIYSPDSLRLEFEIGHLPCKYDRKGWIQAIPLGGEAPYRLDWFDGSADTRIEHLEEGRYEVKLTDKRGCFVTKKVKINSPDELLLSMDYRQPLGWQRDDGMIWVTPVGGTQPYRYEWHGWENDRDTLEGIPAGNYTVTVTDSHQCNKSISATVTEPSLLEVTVSCVRIISCYGVPDGILRATACGGVGNYRYDWYRLSGRHADFIVSGINCEQLPAGEYKVKVTDGNGITAWSEVYRLVQPELLQAAVTVSALLCKGDTDGKAGAVVNGGTLPYEYIWTNGARTGEIDSLSEGRYLVAVKDAHGCRTEAMGTVVSPDALEVSSKVTDPVCNGGKGSVVLQISGGTGKYRITWADGNSRMKREDLPAGSYPVDVADANGCLWQGVFELFEPEQVNVSLGPERTLCREQEVELRPLNVERITGYKWLKDNEVFSSQPVIRVTEAGTYRLEVVTKKGCRGNGEVTIGKSDAEIDANFAMASEIEAEDILKVVNTCLPMPEYCEWIFPETGTITIVSDDRDMAELIFDRPGEYTIGLRSVEGKCEELLYKNVSVVTEGSGQPVTRGPERVIRDVLVWPNPSNGHFRVRVKLNRKSDGLLRLYALTGVLLRESKCRGDESYELSFNESLPPGIYILHLIFGPEREAVKVAVE